ncbi:MAG: hypothetical protein IJV68_06125 [Clostridia bacterium]|nr:hypothetical protein [Clostridia bacterium]
MELWEEILLQILRDEKIKCSLKGKSLGRLISSKCYVALQKIKNIIEDSSLSDKDCFIKIEEIINAFEELGSNGGSRHDY